MATVYFPRSLVAIISGLPTRAEVEAHTVRELIDTLDDLWPGVQMCLCATGYGPREHIKIFVDGKQSTPETPMRAESVVRILTAISGG